jgi:hypothetical protein
MASIVALVADGMQFGPLVMNILRMGRLVGIPKPDGDGLRPIIVSSFLTKLAGSAIWRSARPTCSKHQSALQKKRGAEIIIHTAREHYLAEDAIIRVDVSNAFNSASRAKIRRRLEDEKVDPDILAFFRTMYVPNATLALFGKDETAFFNFCEGVRQGDAFSGYFFCILMDAVISEFKEKCPELTTDIMSYMDDLTITCLPQDVQRVSDAIASALENAGFTINRAKSAVIAKRHIVIPECIFPRAQNDKRFTMLGANINDNYDDFNNHQMEKLQKFFDKIDELDVHPHPKYTILRLCGSP